LSANHNKQSNGRAENVVKRTKFVMKFHCERDEDVELHIGSILLGFAAIMQFDAKLRNTLPIFLTQGYMIRH
jgi:hypothetical protein